MSPALPPHERRTARRMSMHAPAFIEFEDGSRIAAECVELGVGGLSLRADYVPGEGEILTVEVLSPENAPLARPPLRARVEVKRCHRVEAGVFEIGGAIVEILS